MDTKQLKIEQNVVFIRIQGEQKNRAFAFFGKKRFGSERD
jgi:hypothetical protein